MKEIIKFKRPEKKVINLTKKDVPYFDEIKEELRNGVKQEIKLIDLGNGKENKQS